MSAPTTDEEATRWFDEEFASTVKPAREAQPMSFEAYMERLEERLEHQALVASFRRKRRRSEDS